MLLNYIGWGVSVIAAVAIGLLIGSVPRRRKEEKLLATAREEADQTKKEKLGHQLKGVSLRCA